MEIVQEVFDKIKAIFDIVMNFIKSFIPAKEEGTDTEVTE